jgi:hypothetical protein
MIPRAGGRRARPPAAAPTWPESITISKLTKENSMSQSLHMDQNEAHYFAYGLLSTVVGYDASGKTLSQQDAARICDVVAQALGMPKFDLISRLAEFGGANYLEISDAGAESFRVACGPAA